MEGSGELERVFSALTLIAQMGKGQLCVAWFSGGSHQRAWKYSHCYNWTYVQDKVAEKRYAIPGRSWTSASEIPSKSAPTAQLTQECNCFPYRLTAGSTDKENPTTGAWIYKQGMMQAIQLKSEENTWESGHVVQTPELEIKLMMEFRLMGRIKPNCIPLTKSSTFLFWKKKKINEAIQTNMSRGDYSNKIKD